MEMQKATYECHKKDKNRFVFVTHSNDDNATVTAIETSLEYAKQHYKQCLEGKQSLLNDLARINKELERNKVDFDNELEHFIELADKAAAYKNAMKMKQNREVIMAQLKMSEQTIKDMELQLPELKRMKK